MLAAIVANTTARCHGNKTRLADFLPPWVPAEPQQQTPEEMLAILTRMASAQRGV